jgi:hypothetical protein
MHNKYKDIKVLVRTIIFCRPVERTKWITADMD